MLVKVAVQQCHAAGDGFDDVMLTFGTVWNFREAGTDTYFPEMNGGSLSETNGRHTQHEQRGDRTHEIKSDGPKRILGESCVWRKHCEFLVCFAMVG